MHFVPFDRELVVGERKVVVTAFFLEGRRLGDPGKEILKRLAQMPDGHLRRILGHLQHPGKRVPLDGIELTPQGGVGRFW